MSAASRFTKPDTGLPIVRLDAVAVPVAQTSVELRSYHAFPRSSQVPGKRPTSIRAYAKALVHAVSELVHRICVARRRRESQPLDGHSPRARHSQTISVSQSEVVLCDLMAGAGCQLVPEHRSLDVAANATAEVITGAQVEHRAHVSLPGRGSPQSERSLEISASLVTAERRAICQPELCVGITGCSESRQCVRRDHVVSPRQLRVVRRCPGLSIGSARAESTRQPGEPMM